MTKKTVRDLEVTGKRVLVRVDFNVPLEGRQVADDSRIRAALPTIQYLRERDCRVILMSHLGRPKKGPEEGLRLDPAGLRLGQLLAVPVRKVNELSGPSVEAAVEAMEPGDVLLLENTRFDPREESNDPSLVDELASLGDIYVNDSFSTAHRAHATTAGLAGKLPSVAGLLMEEEIQAIDGLFTEPARPLVVVLGGIKVTEKIRVIDRFLERADQLLIGGAMGYAFAKARGLEVGDSEVEEEGIPVAAAALKKAATSSCEMLLPSDVVVADAFAAQAATRVVKVEHMPEGWMGLDIGPETAARYAAALARAGTVFWNGPMGVFEMGPFAAGTRAVAEAMAACQGVTVVGGGDSVAALNQFGLAGEMDHVCTGGGALLKYIEGADLPGLAQLADVGER